ncbi:hypothetical protein LINGRAHAP2_LOCUS20488 [Linum grandiflorum]
MSGWLKISALACTRTPHSLSRLCQMKWRRPVSTSRLNVIKIGG